MPLAFSAFLPYLFQSTMCMLLLFAVVSLLLCPSSDSFTPRLISHHHLSYRSRLFTGQETTSSTNAVCPKLRQRRQQRRNPTQNFFKCSRQRLIILPQRPLMAVEGDFDSLALERARDEVQAGSIRARGRAMYKFTRPHTIRGTILASIAGTVRALLDTPGIAWATNVRWSALLPRSGMGMIALLFGNAFIVGINQIYDKEIDEMNKPFLPVASGEMSTRFAWIAVLISVTLGPAIVYHFFPPILFYLYSLGILLGTAYSVPPVRSKRNPVWAALTIAIVRGFLLNFGVYYAVKDAMGAPFSWNPKVSFMARFMTIFATVIAITKDLPDVVGDKAYRIETFATQMGVRQIAKGASLALLLNYVHAIASGIIAPRGSFRGLPMIGGHAALAVLLVTRYRQLDPESIPSIKTYYKHIWDLFYLEYALYTLI